MSAESQPIVGICGAIGAGKSVVADLLAELGCLVIDSDRLGHDALQRPEVRRTLVEWWGPEMLDAAGQPDRSRIAAHVFPRPAEKSRLESLIHPLIARRRRAIIDAAKGNPAIQAIVLDSPLLLESNLDRLCDAVLFVDAPRSIRLDRLNRSRGWDAAELDRREAAQIALAEKRARADYVVENDQTIDALRPLVAAILQQILRSPRRARPE